MHHLVDKCLCVWVKLILLRLQLLVLRLQAPRFFDYCTHLFLVLVEKRMDPKELIVDFLLLLDFILQRLLLFARFAFGLLYVEIAELHRSIR